MRTIRTFRVAPLALPALAVSKSTSLRSVMPKPSQTSPLLLYWIEHVGRMQLILAFVVEIIMHAFKSMCPPHFNMAGEGGWSRPY